MEIFKWVFLFAVIGFAVWQLILLAKNIVDREKQKKLKQQQKQDETKATATDIVDKKDVN